MNAVKFECKEHLERIENYVQKINLECGEVISNQLKNKEYDAETYILSQNIIINEFAESIKANVIAFNEAMVNYNRMLSAFESVVNYNKELEAALQAKG